MENPVTQQPRFQSRLGLMGVIVGALAVYQLWGADWPGMVVGAGIGFIVGGAASMFGGTWKYLLVFFASAAVFIWWLLHYVVVQ